MRLFLAFLITLWVPRVGQSYPAPASFSCHTPHLLPLPPHRVPAKWVNGELKQGSKTERDAFGTFPNVRFSDNFVLKWGDQGGVAIPDAEALVSYFERAWDVEVTDMDHPAPPGSNSFLFNVYLGDTGSGTPPTYDAGGYFYLDPEGWPMIVVNPVSITDPYTARTVSPHEFYHAVQHATGNFSTGDYDDWFWEATAEWVVAEIYPYEAAHSQFVGAYAMLPHLSVNFFDYPDTGTLPEYHQYGACIFPRYLTEFVADWHLIRDTWVGAGQEDDPLVVLDGLLQAYGTTVWQAFAEATAHNAFWDYELGELYAQLAEAYAGYMPEEDHRVADEVGPEGTDGFRAAPLATLPHRFGYNLIHLVVPGSGAFEVEFMGTAEGSLGNTAEFSAAVVVDQDGVSRYEPIELSTNHGLAQVTDAPPGGEAYLVVAATSPSRSLDEVFAYQFSVQPQDTTPIPTGPDPPDSASGATEQWTGGCRQAPARQHRLWGPWLLVGWLGTLCRRQSRHAVSAR